MRSSEPKLLILDPLLSISRQRPDQTAAHLQNRPNRRLRAEVDSFDRCVLDVHGRTVGRPQSRGTCAGRGSWGVASNDL